MTTDNINLTWEHFKLEPVGKQGHFYYSCIMADGKEVAIEPCFAGYDIAVYSLEQDEFGRKLLTDPKPCVGSTNRAEVVSLASGLLAQVNEEEREDSKNVE